MPLPVERGRIVVNPDLSVARHAGRVGDRRLRARHATRYDDKPAPPTAQFAVREARMRGANRPGRARAAADARVRAIARAASMAAIGHRKGVADVFGIPLSGLPAWLLWRAYYLSQMPTFGRKLRIFVEWTWGMFFPNDITHLRFTRSQELDELGTARRRHGSPGRAARELRVA